MIELRKRVSGSRGEGYHQIRTDDDDEHEGGGLEEEYLIGGHHGNRFDDAEETSPICK